MRLKDNIQSLFCFFCLHYFLQKFLDRCIVEEGDPENEDYKVTSLQETINLNLNLNFIFI